MAKPTISAASGTAVRSSGGPRLSQILEAAMVAATEKCFADGITDPDKIRAAKLKAYEAAKAKFSATATSGS